MKYVPNFLRILREGYDVSAFRADASAGLTVAIVALPLSMAIAIAAGVGPAMGLATAIVGGFLVSAFGSSRFQIGGPAGAFIVLIAAAVQQHGIDGLVLATVMAGVMLAILGMLRLGAYVQFVPFPVTVGFTAGIAAIIFASQITPLLGLVHAGPEPAELIHRIPALWAALPTANPATIALSAGTILLLLALKRYRPHWPRMLIGVVAASLAAKALALPVATIQGTFGALPPNLPAPHLPELSLDKVVEVLPVAVAFALLGAIESLLSAVVADGMSGGRHDSDSELIGQGVANVGSALVGGFCVTGTIARTATNVRAGARSPISGMLHAVFLLGFMMVAAPLVGFIPLAALAAVLTLVCWDMVEKPAIAALTRASRADAAVLYVTLLLTLFRDLTEAIVVGFGLGALLFIHRMAGAVEVAPAAPTRAPDATHLPPDVMVYRVSGALFFGAVSAVAAVLERLDDEHKVIVVDFAEVTLADSSAAHMIEGLAHKAEQRGMAVYLSGAPSRIRRELLAHGLRPPLVHYAASVEAAVASAQRRGQTAAPAAA